MLSLGANLTICVDMLAHASFGIPFWSPGERMLSLGANLTGF
jgi:hypothetical protein